MNTTSRSIRTVIVAATVVAITMITGAAADHGLLARRGVIEIGEPQVVEVGGIIIASLPPLEIVAGREERFAALGAPATVAGPG